MTAVPDAQLRPIAADDVASGLVQIALADPRNGPASITGPEVASFTAWLKLLYERTNDPRDAITDKTATYFGAPLEANSIVPEAPDFVGRIGFDEWFDTPAAKAALGGDRYADAARMINKHGSH